MKTATIVKKYAKLVSAEELAGLEASINDSLPRFFESSNDKGLVVKASDLVWSVSRVDGEHGENNVDDQLCSTLYMVKAFDMVDFFAIDEDLDGDEVVLYASLT